MAVLAQFTTWTPKAMRSSSLRYVRVIARRDGKVDSTDIQLCAPKQWYVVFSIDSIDAKTSPRA
jgi:hypothetical protein